MKILKMNKKAEEKPMMGELLKVILAVAVIVILVILSVKLYGIFTKKADIEQARATLTNLVAKINSLEDKGEGVWDKFLVSSPKNWAIVIVSKVQSDGKCLTDNCLCVCDYANLDDINNYKSQCVKEAVCQDVEVKTYTIIKSRKKKWGFNNDLWFEDCCVIDEIFDLYFIKEGNQVRLTLSGPEE